MLFSVVAMEIWFTLHLTHFLLPASSMSYREDFAISLSTEYMRSSRMERILDTVVWNEATAEVAWCR